MKKILSIVLGMGLALSLGMAYAEESTGGAKDTTDKIIRDDDLLRYELDQEKATINQMPAEPGMAGSAPGGVSGEQESVGTDLEQSEEPVDKGTAEPGAEGTGAGGASRVPERY